MNKTPIEWCRTYTEDGKFEEGFTLNPVRFRPNIPDAPGKLNIIRSGTMCQKISDGCKHCYAENQSRRWWPKQAGPFPGYTAQGVAAGEFWLNEETLMSVFKRKKPARVFWEDMSDLFLKQVPDDFIDRCVSVCILTPHLTHMFLSKRSNRMADYFGISDTMERLREAFVGRQAGRLHLLRTGEPVLEWSAFPIPNLLLGFSAEDPKQFHERWQWMKPLAARGWKIFCSAEPLLEDLDISEAADPAGPRLSWLIAGGESGRQARPCPQSRIRKLWRQCRDASIPFFFKQWGEWGPDHDMVDLRLIRSGVEDTPLYKMGKKNAGALLDGREWRQFPVLE